MTWLGDLRHKGTLDFKIGSEIDGAPAAFTVSPALTIYKANSLIQSTAGITLSETFDTVVGLHNVRLLTTDAFYVQKTDYHFVLTAGTLGGVDLTGLFVASFSIEHRVQRGLFRNVLLTLSAGQMINNL